MTDEVLSEASLIFDCLVGGVPVRLMATRGQSGAQADLRFFGAVQLDRKLSSFLDGWQDNEVLEELFSGKFEDNVESIELRSVAASYADGVLEANLGMAAGADTAALRLFKAIKAKGAGVALEIRTRKLSTKDTFLANLIGDLSIDDIVVAYSSATTTVPWSSADADKQARGALFGFDDQWRRGLKKGITARAIVHHAGQPLLGAEAPTESPEPLATQLSESDQGSPAKEGTSWFEIGKSLGPVSLRRVGFAFTRGKFQLRLDAALELSVLSFSLDGLGLEIELAQVLANLKNPGEIPRHLQPTLDGASLSFTAGIVTVSGGLYVANREPLELTGYLTVQSKLFSVVALGSYSTTDAGAPSFFLFGALKRDLGGPTFFFVTGIAFGLGINRNLTLPPIEKVHEFPLVKAAWDPSYPDPEKDSLATMSSSLTTYVAVAPDQYWIAAGIRFRSFELIEALVLLSVAIGPEIVIGVLGMASISLPNAEQRKKLSLKSPLAKIELALRVSFEVKRGIIKAEAALTPSSYIFDERCRLSGGFSFYLWLNDFKEEGKANVPAGEFVLSVGGYHPKFQPPAHYPKVPRLALDWRLSDKVQIHGEAYFALLPTCVMAGGRLSAVFQDGPLRAWFDLHADLLLSWAPLHYDVEVGIHLGVSYTVNVFGARVPMGFSLGAQAHIWGPPFAGEIHVNLAVVSFTIPLGEGKKEAPKVLTWREFQTTCLKSDEGDFQPVTCKALGGLIAEKGTRPAVGSQGSEESQKPQKSKEIPTMNPYQLKVEAKSVVPYLRCLELDVESEGPIYARPMNQCLVQSTLSLSLEKNGAAVENLGEILQLQSTRENVPLAVWCDDKATDQELKNGPSLPQTNGTRLKDVRTGVVLTARPPTLGEGKEGKVFKINENLKFNWAKNDDNHQLSWSGPEARDETRMREYLEGLGGKVAS